MLISIGRGAADAHPTLTECSWDQFRDWLYTLPRTTGPKDGPYVCLAAFNDGHRSLATLNHSCGVPLDFDKGTVGLEQIAATLQGYSYVSYTTHGHTEVQPRWRVFVPVSAPMDAATHKATWATLQAAFQGQADPAASDASRLSYLPGSCIDLTAARIAHADGALLVPTTPVAEPTPTLQVRGEGPVPGWNGPTDDAELLRQACGLRTKVDEKFGGYSHLGMLWTANEPWLAQRFPPDAPDVIKGRAWNYSKADAELANELTYYTGGDAERVAHLMRQSGLARVREGDEDWADRKVYAAIELAQRGRGETQYHFMQRGKPVDAPSPADIDATVTLKVDDVPVGTYGPVGGTAAELAAIMGMQVPEGTNGLGEVYDPNAPPSYILNKKMQYPATLENVVYVLGKQRQGTLGYDEFRGEVMVSAQGVDQWRTLTDTDYIRMREVFGKELRFEAVGKEIMRDAVQLVAERNKFDSAKTWLTGLVWDGVPRVQQFLTTHCGSVDTPYIRAVSRYVWTGLAGRIMSPGCQLDMVVVLQSPQGRGKSTGLAAMVPDEEHFTDGLSLHEGGDDFKRMLKGKLVVEIAELAGLSKADVNVVKRTITRRHEEWVEKWETKGRRYQRRCMLFGTVNDEQFLPPDETGNRRWLPVPGVSLDREAIARDRLQLWAEGLAIYQTSGIAWKDAETLAPAEHEPHKVIDLWTDVIEAWLDRAPPQAPEQPTPLPPPRMRPFGMHEVMSGALRLDMGRQDQRAEKRAAAVLSSLGYERKIIKLDGKTRRMWAHRG